MASKDLAIVVQVTPRWWLQHYLQAVVLLAWVFDCELNEERVKYWFKRGWRVRYRIGNRWHRIQF
jgi:hypothetical protein